MRSVECGFRPRASEISLPAPANLPLGDDHASSVSSFELIFFMRSSYEFIPPSPTADSRKGWGQLVPTGYQNRFFPSGDGPSLPLFALIESAVSVAMFERTDLESAVGNRQR